MRSDEKVQTHGLEHLISDKNLDPTLKPYVEVYLHAEAQYHEKFQAWFDSKPGDSTRILLKQAQVQAVTPGEESFVWKGRAEVLEKRVQLLDRVVREGFTALYDAYNTKVGEESNALRGRLSQIDPSLVGESRWGNSSWKIVRLFTWMGNAYSGWKKGDEAADLKRKYQALQNYANVPMPTTADGVSRWMTERPRVEELLSAERKQSLQESRESYVQEVAPHLKHETFEAVIVGTDGEISPEQELRMLYQSLKVKNPDLRHIEGEQIEYIDRARMLRVKGEGFEVTVGAPAEALARRSIATTLMKNDELGEVSSVLRDKIIPPNVVGFVEWSGSSKREILYAQHQIGTFENVGEKGDRDLLKSKIVASDRIVYETTPEGEVKFNEGDLRFGCYVLDYGKALKKASRVVKAVALPVLQSSYPNGTKVTLNLTSMSVGLVENKEKKKISTKGSLNYSLNEENQIELADGEEFNATLTKLAKNNEIGHYKGLPKLRANFEGISWKTI
ncbi:hypothetical protein [Simkania sp.]|uniref:hypothetical protein n=1 Tax=Simkania sp. TaxID=34094 RepID=UPI003B5262E4